MSGAASTAVPVSTGSSDLEERALRAPQLTVLVQCLTYLIQPIVSDALTVNNPIRIVHELPSEVNHIGSLELAEVIESS